MPRYKYTAKVDPQKTIQGDMEAETEQDAVNKIFQMGYFPVSVSPEHVTLGPKSSWSFRKVTSKDIVLLTRQLSVLIESGVNILTSMGITSKQLANEYLRAVLNDVSSKIKDGRSLSESLNTHPRIFSSLYTSMVRSGEMGGNIEIALKRLADFLEKEEEFKNSVRSALTYPFFIFIVGAITVIVLLGFVIPRMVSMFADMGQVLPIPTQILISISNFVRKDWWLILAAVFMGIFLLRRAYRRPQGKITLDRLKLNLPLVGEISLKTEIGRLCRTLSLLLSSGLPVVNSLDIVISMIGNQILKLEMLKFKDQIAGGSSFSKCLSDSKVFPAFVTNIVTVGEEAGTLEKALLRIADDYEREVDNSLKTLMRLIEPVIILVMGLFVGFIVVSILLPIFQINLIVK